MRRCKNHREILIAILVLLTSAQGQQPATPAVSFTCDFPGSDPSHYVISVSSDGRASYTSDGKLSLDSDPAEPITLDFTMPQPTLTRTFELAKKAHYFEGEIDSKNKNVASTGQKILAYKDAQRNTSAKYNYSPIPAVQELTAIFQSLSMTLEFGRRLEFEHRYQKLALDEELGRMSDLSSRNETGDAAVIAPILRKIVGDPSVVNAARMRAQRLLDRAGEPSK